MHNQISWPLLPNGLERALSELRQKERNQFRILKNFVALVVLEGRPHTKFVATVAELRPDKTSAPASRQPNDNHARNRNPTTRQPGQLSWNTLLEYPSQSTFSSSSSSPLVWLDHTLPRRPLPNDYHLHRVCHMATVLLTTRHLCTTNVLVAIRNRTLPMVMGRESRW